MPDLLGIVEPVFLDERHELELDDVGKVVIIDKLSVVAEETAVSDGKAASEAERLTYLRTVFSSLLITGPFSIVLGFNGGLMALNDRLKLRSMVTAEKDDLVFIASEEAAIRAMEPDASNVWAPMGGEPVIVRVKEGKY